MFALTAKPIGLPILDWPIANIASLFKLGGHARLNIGAGSCIHARRAEQDANFGRSVRLFVRLPVRRSHLGGTGRGHMAMGLAVERTANTGHLAYLGAGCGGVGRPAEDARSTFFISLCHFSWLPSRRVAKGHTQDGRVRRSSLAQLQKKLAHLNLAFSSSS